MLYFTGDTHGEKGRFSEEKMPSESKWTKEDVIFVCGDFGYIMYDDDGERAYLDELAKKPYTICFCDGNHENFTALNSYPVEIWNGGKIHRIRPNIIHLMRGQIFNIQGKKIFSMGGAYSSDKALKRGQGLHWSEELPNNEEYQEAINNLKNVDFQVDYIISHTAPKEIIHCMGKIPDMHDAELTGFLEWVMYETKFKAWYFGHWHMDKTVYGIMKNDLSVSREIVRALWYDVVQAE